MNLWTEIGLQASNKANCKWGLVAERFFWASINLFKTLLRKTQGSDPFRYGAPFDLYGWGVKRNIDSGIEIKGSLHSFIFILFHGLILIINTKFEDKFESIKIYSINSIYKNL